MRIDNYYFIFNKKEFINILLDYIQFEKNVALTKNELEIELYFEDIPEEITLEISKQQYRFSELSYETYSLTKKQILTLLIKKINNTLEYTFDTDELAFVKESDYLIKGFYNFYELVADRETLPYKDADTFLSVITLSKWAFYNNAILKMYDTSLSERYYIDIKEIHINGRFESHIRYYDTSNNNEEKMLYFYKMQLRYLSSSSVRNNNLLVEGHNEDIELLKTSYENNEVIDIVYKRHNNQLCIITGYVCGLIKKDYSKFYFLYYSIYQEELRVNNGGEIIEIDLSKVNNVIKSCI